MPRRLSEVELSLRRQREPARIDPKPTSSALRLEDVQVMARHNRTVV